MPDNMFDSSPTPSVEGVFGIKQIVSSDRKRRKDALQLAKIRSKNRGSDLLNEFNDVMAATENGADIKALEDTEKQDYLDKKNKEKFDYLLNGASSPDYQETAANYIKMNELENEAISDPDDGTNLLYSELFASEDISDYRKRQEVTKSYVYDLAEELFEENNVAETAGNFVADLLAPDEIKDFFDYAKMIGTDWNGMLAEMSYFQTLDAEEQKVVMEERLPLIAKAADNNPFVVRSMIEMYYSDDIVQDMTVKGALDASVLLFDVGPILGGLLKLGKRVKAGRSSVSRDAAIGNVDQAGAETLLTGADKTGEAVKTMDMNTVDAGTTASPTKGIDELPNGAVDGVSAPAQEIRKAVLDRIIEDLLPSAGNKISKGAAKRLRAKKQGIEYDIEKINRQLKNLEGAKLGEKALTTRQITSLEDRKRLLVGQLESVDALTASNKTSAQAAADISRLQQGIVPENLKSTFDQMVSAKAAKLARPIKTREADSLKAEVGASRNGTPDSAKEDIVEALANPSVLDSPELYGLTPQFVDTLVDSVRKPMREAAEIAERESIQALSPEMQRVAQKEAVESLKKRMTNTGKVFKSIELTDSTPTGFKIKAVTDDGLDSTFEYDYKLSDSGSLVSDPELAKSNVIPALRNVFSPDVVWREMLGEFISNITYAGQQSAKLANTLSKKYKDIEKGLSKQDGIDVDTLMQLGDEESTVFTYKELRYGMKEIHLDKQGIKKEYSDDVIRAYYKKRAFYDELHMFRNDMMYNQFKFMGFKNINYNGKSGASLQMMGKVYEDTRGIAKQLNDADVFVIDNMFNKEARFLGSKNEHSKKKLTDAGYKAVKLAEPMLIKKGEKGRATWALVREERVTALPKQVLNYSAGYVPRIYRSGYYFVKNMDGVHNETLYAFQKKADAQKYVDELHADPNSGYEKLQVREDREFSEFEKLNNNADSYGGLYTSHRKTSPLMVKGIDGAEDFRPERLSAAQATQRYIQGISDIMPTNTYRMSMVEQWRNTVNQVAKMEGRDWSLSKADGFDAKLNLSPHSTKLMNDAREYLRRSLNIPSEQETFFSNTMRDIGNIMEGSSSSSLNKGGDWVLNQIHKDPVRALKGLTFNLHLGWFNVRQLWVQAQNASLALSMHPINGAKAVAEYLPTRAAILSDNPDVWREVARRAKMDEAKFVENIKSIKDSGILDAIVRTADFDANVAGIGSSTFQGFRKAAKAGRIFYEEGEMSGRLIAWNVAKRNLRDEGKEVTPKSLSEETLRMHMNLQAENAAVWQTNVLGVPTQFQQVFAKFAENMLPAAKGGTGKWTDKEKLSVLAGQIVLYGTVGVPLAEDFLAAGAEALGTTPLEIEKDNPTVMEGLEEGVWGVMLDTLGIENNFSESGNLLAGLKSNLATQLVLAFVDHMSGNDVDVDVIDVALGAGGNSIMRGKDAVVRTYEAARNIYTYPSPATLGQELIGVLDGLASTTSTWSNARKAMFAKHYGMGLRSKRGTVILTTEELGLNWQTAMARAFGFETDIENALWRTYEYNKESRDSIRQTTEDLRHAYESFMITGNVELWRARRAAIMGPYANTEAGRTIDRNFNRSTVSGDSMFTKQSEAFTKDYIGNGGTMPLEAGTLLNEER